MNSLVDRLRLPLIGAPMFLASSPQLVIAQCRSGIAGTIPSLNARPLELFEDWLSQIDAALADGESAPYGVNLIVAKGNDRLEQDLSLCEKFQVPLIITSVGAPGEVVAAVHNYGGLVFHDVVSVRHAEKAAAEGVDGIVAVCAGAGGHGGTMSPFAFAKEIRQVFNGAIVLAGGMSSGADILAARVMGADFAYMGTRFLATEEAQIDPEYKKMLLASNADEIVYTDLFTGIRANYLARSIARTGLDPRTMPAASAPGVGTGGHGEFAVWKDIWGAGQGVGALRDAPGVAELVDRLAAEYEDALSKICR